MLSSDLIIHRRDMKLDDVDTAALNPSLQVAHHHAERKQLQEFHCVNACKIPTTLFQLCVSNINVLHTGV